MAYCPVHTDKPYAKLHLIHAVYLTVHLSLILTGELSVALLIRDKIEYLLKQNGPIYTGALSYPFKSLSALQVMSQAQEISTNSIKENRTSFASWTCNSDNNGKS